jgi:hypothetical protein
MSVIFRALATLIKYFTFLDRTQLWKGGSDVTVEATLGLLKNSFGFILTSRGRMFIESFDLKEVRPRLGSHIRTF